MKNHMTQTAKEAQFKKDIEGVAQDSIKNTMAIVKLITENRDMSDFFVADRTIDTLEDFRNDEAVANVVAGFQTSHPSATFYRNNDIKFIKAYVIGDDVFTHYIADGIKFIRKESVHRSIDNAGLHNVSIFPDGFHIQTGRAFAKHNKAREHFRKHDMTMCSVYMR